MSGCAETTGRGVDGLLEPFATEPPTVPLETMRRRVTGGVWETLVAGRPAAGREPAGVDPMVMRGARKCVTTGIAGASATPTVPTTGDSAAVTGDSVFVTLPTTGDSDFVTLPTAGDRVAVTVRVTGASVLVTAPATGDNVPLAVRVTGASVFVAAPSVWLVDCVTRVTAGAVTCFTEAVVVVTA